MIWHDGQGGLSRRERFCRLYEFQTVERSVRWESGGYIPSLDHACQPCPQENFEYYLGLVRSLSI